MKDHRRVRARKAGEKLMLHLEKREIREAWGSVWGLYKAVDPKLAKPCFRTMEEQTKGRKDIYGFQQLPSEPILRNVEREPSDDRPPIDDQLPRATKRNGNGKSGSAYTMRVEDLKTWLREAEAEKKAAQAGEEGHKGKGDMWWLLVKLVQYMLETGEIHQ